MNDLIIQATWITAVVLDHPIHELSVRGIAIPHLDVETRTTLVELLTPVLAERTDLEVCMEWFQPVRCAMLFCVSSLSCCLTLRSC